MNKQKVSKDALFTISPKKVGPTAVRVIDAIQLEPAELQCAGVALAFLIVCERLKIHPGTVMSVAGRVLEECRSNHEVAALRMYMKEEFQT